MKDGTCHQLVLPQFVYKLNSQYHGVDNRYCQLSESARLSTCSIPIFRNQQQINCLQDFSNCTLVSTRRCHSRYAYDNAGILVATDKTIQVFTSHSNGQRSIVQLEPNEFGTKFISWTDVTYVQVEEVQVEMPRYVGQYITETFGDTLLARWTHLLNISHTPIDEESLTQSIGDQIQAINKMQARKSSKWPYVALFAAIASTCLIFVMIGYKTSQWFFKSRKNGTAELTEKMSYATLAAAEADTVQLPLTPAEATAAPVELHIIN